MRILFCTLTSTFGEKLRMEIKDQYRHIFDALDNYKKKKRVDFSLRNVDCEKKIIEEIEKLKRKISIGGIEKKRNKPSEDVRNFLTILLKQDGVWTAWQDILKIFEKFQNHNFKNNYRMLAKLKDIMLHHRTEDIDVYSLNKLKEFNEGDCDDFTLSQETKKDYYEKMHKELIQMEKELEDLKNLSRSDSQKLTTEEIESKSLEDQYITNLANFIKNNLAALSAFDDLTQYIVEDERDKLKQKYPFIGSMLDIFVKIFYFDNDMNSIVSLPKVKRTEEQKRKIAEFLQMLDGKSGIIFIDMYHCPNVFVEYSFSDHNQFFWIFNQKYKEISNEDLNFVYMKNGYFTRLDSSERTDNAIMILIPKLKILLEKQTVKPMYIIADDSSISSFVHTFKQGKNNYFLWPHSLSRNLSLKFMKKFCDDDSFGSRTQAYLDFKDRVDKMFSKLDTCEIDISSDLNPCLDIITALKENYATGPRFRARILHAVSILVPIISQNHELQQNMEMNSNFNLFKEQAESDLTKFSSYFIIIIKYFKNRQ